MDNEKRGHIPFVLLHALLYIAGAVCVALLFVLKSKALGIIGLLLLFAAVLMTFLGAVRRINEARNERKN